MRTTTRTVLPRVQPALGPVPARVVLPVPHPQQNRMVKKMGPPPKPPSPKYKCPGPKNKMRACVVVVVDHALCECVLNAEHPFSEHVLRAVCSCVHVRVG